MTVASWVAGYLKAWESNEEEDIRALFTEDAVYRFAPHDEEPLEGIDDILEGWLESADDPGSFRFEYEVLVDTPELGIVQGVTEYVDAETYSNLWVVRFAEDGRARDFTEWALDQDD